MRKWVSYLCCLLYSFKFKINLGHDDNELNSYFESFLNKGLEQIQSICKENQIKPVIITVYAQQEGHKPLPTEHELKVLIHNIL